MNKLFMQENNVSTLRRQRNCIVIFKQSTRDLPPGEEPGTVAFVVETMGQQAATVAARNYVQRSRFDRLSRS